MLRLTGFHSCPESIKGHPFVMSFNRQSVTMTDYSTTDGAKVYNARLELPPAPYYYRRQDNSGKWYEMLEWQCDWQRDFFRFSHVSIQTWDRREVYPLIYWPHKRFTFRGAPLEMMSESAIAVLDDKSIRALVALLDGFRK